ncbi:AIPR family protein [Nitrospirillum viridazoti]|uniref:Abortive phage infection protein C-terminal domain-containing protein n=1 Tax=Nitrospirillum viridazoti CBAmc TaxID=1441467 RepID=A0A248JYN9_9PROT|nr:AIPR family protein [Nitrospirillum amazonense]ASG23835.1 hypothetical protein Y958_23000 [Nitrospirillum amazonense CBAmc]TWB44746.1 AIPR protein [Nitrospirillum amazonense]
MSYIDLFKKESSLISKLGIEQAHTAWVMARYLEEADIGALAANALTDGPNDKKIDFIYLDHDGKRIIFAQGFFANKARDEAPANKASDLNTAAAWLLSGDLSVVPDQMRLIMEECRVALEVDGVDSIELFYIHNLPESVNVARELQTVEDNIKKILGGRAITVRAVELGIAKIQHLSDSQDSHIEVKDDIEFPAKIAFQENGPNWRAYVASVPGIWLHSVFNKYSDSLFSANYRGYLGGGRRRRVNTGIRESAETRPADFWAFNNGITILTKGFKIDKSGTPVISGMSVINGAQTTGSIGSVDIGKKNISDLRVLCRVIESSDSATIDEIVKFNNTQNAITSWDQYSNDPDQKRLVQEFRDLGFVYNIKRGFVGEGDQLGIDEVIQPLLAYHGRPLDANRGKNQIFDRKQLYQNAFDGKKARHVLFVYSLGKAIDERRLALKNKSNEGSLLQVESDQLSLMRNLKFKAFFTAMVASTIETALGKKCDAQTIGFSHEASMSNTLVELIARWSPVVDTLLALITATDSVKDFGVMLSDDTFIPNLAKQVNALLHAMGAASKHSAFAELVTGT